MTMHIVEKAANHQSRFSNRREAIIGCIACGDSAVVRGPLDYPDLDNSSCCGECEAGRALASRLAQAVERTLGGGRERLG